MKINPIPDLGDIPSPGNTTQLSSQTPQTADEELEGLFLHTHSCHSQQAWTRGQTQPFPCDCYVKESVHQLKQLVLTEREIFVPVKGAEGHYEVSNTGKVRSVLGGRRRGIELKQSPRVKWAAKSYMVVSLVKDGKGQTVTVHRIVARAFLSNPENKPCVNHKDGNRANNDVNNLEWVTYQENEQHAWDKLGKTPYNKGTAFHDVFNCLFCGEPFTRDSRNPNKKHCSHKCATTAHHRKLEQLHHQSENVMVHNSIKEIMDFYIKSLIKGDNYNDYQQAIDALEQREKELSDNG